MKKFSISRFLPALLVLVTITLSSCNRGYGCPTNFSVNDLLVDVVTGVVHLLF